LAQAVLSQAIAQGAFPPFVSFRHCCGHFAMAGLRVLLALFAVARHVSASNVGSCGGANPSKVADCQNADMGSCGNACCKLLFTVAEDPLSAMQKLNASFANGGADGLYTLQMTAEGTLGFGDLRALKIPSGEQFIGQVHHKTSGPKHYVDVIDFNIRAAQCKEGVVCNGEGSVIKAFSLSLIGGALGDNGQNYKNIVNAMKNVEWKFDQGNADTSCAAALAVV